MVFPTQLKESLPPNLFGLHFPPTQPVRLTLTLLPNLFGLYSPPPPPTAMWQSCYVANNEKYEFIQSIT